MRPEGLLSTAHKHLMKEFDQMLYRLQIRQIFTSPTSDYVQYPSYGVSLKYGQHIWENMLSGKNRELMWFSTGPSNTEQILILPNTLRGLHFQIDDW